MYGFAVHGKIEARALVVLGRAKPGDEVDDLQRRPGSDRAPQHRDDDAFGLDKQLAGRALEQAGDSGFAAAARCQGCERASYGGTGLERKGVMTPQCFSIFCVTPAPGSR